MPAVRFSRDKRGYEYVYLVHTPTRRGKPGRTRVLYWYRTPPGVRVGRKPFDEEVQRTVEQQNPGVTFDWPAIIKAEMPPPDMTEFWRERRRLEKVARQERRAAEAEESDEALEPEPSEPVEAGAAEALVEAEPAESPVEASGGALAPDAIEGADAAGASTAQKKRRRRRGGRRRKGAVGAADGGDAGPSDGEGEPAGDTESDSSGDEPSE